MKKSLCSLLASILIVLLCICTYTAKADISREAKKKNKELREANGVIDYQYNTVGNLSFPITNEGLNFFNVNYHQGACFWPRGWDNLYIFGAGLWFAAKKYHTLTSGESDTSYYRKYVELSYNPNSGSSWFVPGRIEDGYALDTAKLKDYRVYFSTDMNSSGAPVDNEDGPNWPIWQADDYSDNYIYNTEERNLSSNPKGPSYKSDEDIFCTYKDTDLNHYEGGLANRATAGYPLGLQFEQLIYSWDDGPMEDGIIIYYKAINMSSDTLIDCWFAPVFDPDIAYFSNPSDGARNDRANFYQEDSLDFAYFWSNTDRGEAGKGFGYMCFSMILSPAVDENGFVRHDKSKYDSDEQLGMVTFRNWPIEDDPTEDDARYNFVSASVVDGDDGPGDKRIMFSSGPFHMLPGDTVETAISINMALPAVNDEADGSLEDIAGLIESVKTSRKTFFNKLLPNIVEENYPEKNDLLIYPNPADDYINVTFSSCSASKVSVEITDVFGNSDYYGTEYMDAANNKFIIDTRALQQGVYYLNINDGKNSFTKILNIIK